MEDQAVTIRENNLRSRLGYSGINAAKVRCVAGHKLRGKNVRIVKTRGGYEGRIRKTCHRIRQRLRYRRIHKVAPAKWQVK